MPLFNNGTPKSAFANFAVAANTSLTNPGAGGKTTLFTPSAKSVIKTVVATAIETTVADKIRLWRVNGGTYYFLGEITIDAAAPSDTVSASQGLWSPLGELILESGDTLVATTYAGKKYDTCVGYGELA